MRVPRRTLTLSIFGQAAPGWDPVTGLGTPDFGKMKAYLSQNKSLLGSLLGGLFGALDISIYLKLL